MNRKSNILDWFFIIMLLFMTGICIFVAHIVVSNTSIQDLWEKEGVTNVTTHTDTAILSFDNLMLFAIIGLSLFVLISAALVFNHPAFFFLSLFLLAIAVVFSAIISNAFWDFTDSALISVTASAFPKIVFLMNNLPLYIAFMGIASIIVMYVSYTRQ